MLTAIPYFLKFKYPFQLSTSTRRGTDNLYVKIEAFGAVGLGEAVFPPYISETQQQAIELVHQLKIDFTINNFSDFIKLNCATTQNYPSLNCALEGCLTSWWADKNKVQIADLMGVKAAQKPTSYTIGICSDAEMIQRIHDFPEATYFKLKVSETEIERIIKTYRENCNKPFVVDANQGFQSKEEALKWANTLFEMGAEYFEQPFHKSDLAAHQWLKNQTNINIIADESLQRLTDLPKVMDAFDGINVKIIKCGGLTEAKAIIETARNHELTTILGCMSGSSVSIGYASNLINLVDYVDLDGPFLITNDPDINKLIEM